MVKACTLGNRGTGRRRVVTPLQDTQGVAWAGLLPALRADGGIQRECLPDDHFFPERAHLGALSWEFEAKAHSCLEAKRALGELAAQDDEVVERFVERLVGHGKPRSAPLPPNRRW